ncbi:hypothetical protein [Streptomyces sp. SID5910]|uniref:hypothetical protein n=1 Tax=Streptomyces sp. SID5910 TaxID=2690312 RepID=UPI001368A990|nr:hypothetical protein [Streptomyces sp. SID5910]MYR46261.1 hypothetical protein [Streptomyces sp. SID5910]
MAGQGPELIGREILRLDALSERDGHRMGKEWRKRTETRREALLWALHVILTNAPTTPPGPATQTFLDALKHR